MESTMGGPPLTVQHVLRHGSSWHGTTEVVTYQAGVRRCATFAEVGRRAARLAGGLRSIGVEGDARVGTLMWNNQEHLEAYLAVPAMGAVLHSANLRLFPEQLAFTVNAAEDLVMIVDEDLVEQFVEILPELGTVRSVVVNGSDVPPVLSSSGLATYTYEEIIAAGNDEFDWPELDENAAAALCFTTGTTGDPKGVAYSHRSILLHSMSSATMNALRIGDEDRMLIVVPMFHALAWGYPYTAFWFGADLVLPSKHLDPASILDLLETERVTFANGVPTIWTAVMQELTSGPDRDIASLQRVGVGGAPLAPALFDAFAGIGVSMLQGWGMTEASPLATVSQPEPSATSEEQREQRLCQGRILAGVEVRLSDTDTGDLIPIADDAVGELEIRGPWVSTSYLNGTGEDRFSDGWLRTGDVGTVDRSGYVRLTDRSKDIIKSGGEWISSVDLENTLNAHPLLFEVAVIGVPDERWDERPCAIVVPLSGAEIEADVLRSWLDGQVAKWWIPERWVVVQEIPKTSVGKIDKKVLRAEYEAGRLQLID